MGLDPAPPTSVGAAEKSVRFFCPQCRWSMVITAEFYELAYRRYWMHAQRHLPSPRIEEHENDVAASR